jgi:hypothetical protein
MGRSIKKPIATALLLLLAALSKPASTQAGMVLTAAGINQGFSLSTFASGFPVSQGVGPIGIAFPVSGGVLVADYPGDVLHFLSDSDGQIASSASIAQSYGNANATGMAQIGNRIYMNEAANSQVIQLNQDGTFNQLITTISNPVTNNLSGMTVNPMNGHLFVSVPTDIGSFNEIVDIDPIAKTSQVFLSGTFTDGLAFNATASILYAVTGSSGVTGYDTATAAIVFGPVSIAGGPDGIALGTGSLAGNLFVNTNGGQILELNLNTLTQSIIGSGGSRGDLLYVDPNNDTLLVTQGDSVLRLTAPSGGGFLLSNPVPEPSSLMASIIGWLVLAGFSWRTKKSLSIGTS